MKRTAVLLAGLILSLSATLPARADTLFSQTPTNTSKWLSQTSSGSSGAHQVYDDFTLASVGAVGNVSWTALMYPTFATINGFSVSFYNDSGSNTPGSLISSTSIVGDADETAAGQTINGYGVFNFSAPVTFLAEADTEYWISIVADTPSALWGWSSSTGQDSNLYQDNGNTDINGDPILQQVGTDVAFTLSTASVVPEPSSLMLAGTGIMTLAGLMRWRFIGG